MLIIRYMQNMNNIYNMTGVGICVDFKQEQHLVEQDIIHPELKSTI